MDGICLPYGSPVDGLSISNCNSILDLYFSDSLRSVNFILVMTDFCFWYDPFAVHIHCSPGWEEMDHCVIHLLMKAQYVHQQVDGIGQWQERSWAGVPLWSTMLEGVAGMGCDVGHICLWRSMRGGRWLLQVTLECLSWMGVSPFLAIE